MWDWHWKRQRGDVNLGNADDLKNLRDVFFREIR